MATDPTGDCAVWYRHGYFHGLTGRHASPPADIENRLDYHAGYRDGVAHQSRAEEPALQAGETTPPHTVRAECDRAVLAVLEAASDLLCASAPEIPVCRSALSRALTKAVQWYRRLPPAVS